MKNWIQDSLAFQGRRRASVCARKESQEWLGCRENSCEVFSFCLLEYFQRAPRVKKG